MGPGFPPPHEPLQVPIQPPFLNQFESDGYFTNSAKDQYNMNSSQDNHQGAHFQRQNFGPQSPTELSSGFALGRPNKVIQQIKYLTFLIYYVDNILKTLST
jgi:hypothetical protein